jgi:hypothetical protein
MGKGYSLLGYWLLGGRKRGEESLLSLHGGDSRSFVLWGTEGTLDGGGFGGLGGVVGEGFEDGLGAGLSGGGSLHGGEGLFESALAEIEIAFVAVEAVEVGGDVEQLVPGIHEVEVEDVFLGGHGESIGMEGPLEKLKLSGAMIGDLRKKRGLWAAEMAILTGCHSRGSGIDFAMGERDHGVQPLDRLMDDWGLENHDLVDVSTEQLTHKQVQKARNGRELTLKMKMNVTRAFNVAIWARLDAEAREAYFEYMHKHLFDYTKGYEAGWEDPNGELKAKLKVVQE